MNDLHIALKSERENASIDIFLLSQQRLADGSLACPRLLSSERRTQLYQHTETKDCVLHTLSYARPAVLHAHGANHRTDDALWLAMHAAADTAEVFRWGSGGIGEVSIGRAREGADGPGRSCHAALPALAIQYVLAATRTGTCSGLQTISVTTPSLMI